MSEFKLDPCLVEEEELFETTNPALLKIVEFKKKFGHSLPREAEFMRKLPEIVDRVMEVLEERKLTKKQVNILCGGK